jgi:D-alanyl-D-alanine carboxypeptidase
MAALNRVFGSLVAFAALFAGCSEAPKPLTDAVLVVKSPCGTRFFTSGPSQYPDSTLQRIASMSKTYTGGVIHTLVRDKVLSYDDPVSRWLDGVPSGDQIKIRDLLGHRSGLYDFWLDDDFLHQVFDVDPTRRWAPEELDPS